MIIGLTLAREAFQDSALPQAALLHPEWRPPVEIKNKDHDHRLSNLPGDVITSLMKGA